MERIEKQARLANFLSFLFCLIAISLNSFYLVTFFIVILAVIQVSHIFLGDITHSYRLLRNKKFSRIYVISLVIFSVPDLLAIFLLNFESKIYFLSIWLAFINDFMANKIRSKIKKKKKKKKKK